MLFLDDPHFVAHTHKSELEIFRINAKNIRRLQVSLNDVHKIKAP